MGHLVDTTEMYLRTIINLEEEGIVPLRARISERLGHAGPTVFQTVGRMQRDGLLVVSSQRNLILTSKGREAALAVVRKHRLAEALLYDVIGLEWEFLHLEACQLEHVMSDHFETHARRLLKNPVQTPYGTPIPPADGQYDPEKAFKGELVTLSAAIPPGGSAFCTLRRLGEMAQTDQPLLQALAAAELKPGAAAQFEESLEGFSALTAAGDRVRISHFSAAGIFVEIQSA